MSVSQERLPWGRLQGVRPVKLAHRAVRSGASSSAQIASILMDGHGVSRARAELAAEVCLRQRALLPLDELWREVSVYVGVPFCPTHCAYCTFPAYSMVDKARYAVHFMECLLREIECVGRVLRESGIAVTSVYVGGGTPTSLHARELAELLAALCQHVPGANMWREFCVEAGRPDTITPDRIAVMKAAGVNRVSVNPQTWRDATLRLIGRGHRADMVAHRFHVLRTAGFDNINMDLILGLPGEGLADVKESVLRTLALVPDAVTIHTLAHKRGSDVSLAPEAYPVAADEEVAAMMAHADGALRGAGYLPHYLYRQRHILAGLENVGYALTGREGVYNICIMEEVQTIVAVGGGAASKWVDPRTGRITQMHNPRDPGAYVMGIERILARKEQELRAACAQIAARLADDPSASAMER
jgi:oxygen-independent coproporphyrinogen-3 oxidase